MGRKPCCWRAGLRKGAWTLSEDHILTNHITIHGALNWRDLPRKAGLERCGKSCRLRWLNYLKPDIKRGSISVDEEDLIIKLHSLLGNKWSLIAGRLPGRTDNEIKNHWNCKLRKRVKNNDHRDHNNHKVARNTRSRSTRATDHNHDDNHEVVRPRAVRCTKVINIPHVQDHCSGHRENRTVVPTSEVGCTNVAEVPNPLYHHDTDQNEDDRDLTLMFDLDNSYGDFLLNTDDHDHSSTNQNQDDHDSVLSFDLDLNGYGDLLNTNDHDHHSTNQNQDHRDKMLMLDLADSDYDNLLLTINDHNHLDLWINSLEEDLILHESSDIGA